MLLRYIVDVFSPERLCRYCIVGGAAGCKLRPSQHWASVSVRQAIVRIYNNKVISIPDI